MGWPTSSEGRSATILKPHLPVILPSSDQQKTSFQHPFLTNKRTSFAALA